MILDFIRQPILIGRFGDRNSIGGGRFGIGRGSSNISISISGSGSGSTGIGISISHLNLHDVGHATTTCVGACEEYEVGVPTADASLSFGLCGSHGPSLASATLYGKEDVNN